MGQNVPLAIVTPVPYGRGVVNLAHQLPFGRILVTGGAGFIGSHLVDRLLFQGRQVCVVDDFNDYYDPELKRLNIGSHLRHANYTLKVGDIRDPFRLDEVFDAFSPDAIVHLAARAGVRPSLADPMLYADVNVRGTMNLLEQARERRIQKFVFASSSSVYGTNEKVPFAETDPLLHPASPYGATKLSGESMCQVYATQFGMHIASLRFFTVYGPRQRPDMAICRFVNRILSGEPIDVYGNGESLRDYTFVADIIDGLERSLDRKARGHEIFNLGCGNPITLNQLIAAIERATGRTAYRNHLPDQPGDVPLTFADVNKAKAMLGYRAETSLEAGVDAFVESLGVSRDASHGGATVRSLA